MNLKQFGKSDVYMDDDTKNSSCTVSNAICTGTKDVLKAGAEYDIDVVSECLGRLKKKGASCVKFSVVSDYALMITDAFNPNTAVIMSHRMPVDQSKDIEIKVNRKAIGNIKRSIKSNKPTEIELEIAKSSSGVL